jgi:hypothetical protein
MTGIKKAGLAPAVFAASPRQAQAELSALRPSLQNYFFLDFFAFLAFFAVFFAFLAIASSFRLMDGNATPRPARGGLASQQPQPASEQIR